ncbi:helix-turn-helix transcriptional regulator [Myxococcus sp. AM009]|uniref:helix-turn-helix transcriptional regulator n=1 Tax=unclassified Myxococcus TaxID=2648731 RepID=UPI0015960E4E|nr:MULTISPECIES: helix-turn-helix transcriptional regulator [unclassified Myxococcus]NVJ00307.1 helix-turn-helix transcriptional regulator [Myxococcus sp. AM009]NVJ17884.1 helix-turn-helix transcriptional regulator [Myxococcus sp. AM010]
MNEELAITIGTVAREAREKLGMTRAEVAERVGLVEPAYGRLERGKVLPSVPVFHRLSLTLGLSPEVLLGTTPRGTGKKKPPRAPSLEAETPELRRLLALARKLDEEKLDALLHVATALTR